MKIWHKSRSFPDAVRNALRGIQFAFGLERNIRAQVLAGVMVVLLAALLKVSILELTVFVLAISMVLSLELMNTALEQLEDLVHPEYHIAVKRSKDVSAGAVLLASVGTVIIGVLILARPLLAIFS